MSSSGEVALQRRPPTAHTNQGELWTGVVHHTRVTEVQASPNKDTLPLTEAVPFTPRPGVHKNHEHKPSLFSARHCKTSLKSGGGTVTDSVCRPQVTRMTGERNKRGWRDTQQTRKVKRKHSRAQRWANKFDN